MEGVQIQSTKDQEEEIEIQYTISYQYLIAKNIPMLEACNVALYAAATAAVRANEDASHIKQDQGEKLIKKIANKIKKINKLRRALESTVDKIKKNMKPARYTVYDVQCELCRSEDKEFTSVEDWIHRLHQKDKRRSKMKAKHTHYNNQNNTQQQEIQTTTRAFEFWSQLWNPPSTEATNYDELEWIQRVKDSNQFKSIKETKFEIEGADISNYTKNKKNWSAPGPDGICNYWIKRIKRYHEDLAEAFNEYLNLDIMEFPKWFCEGITYRIHKGGDKEDEANYRPITCINNTSNGTPSYSYPRIKPQLQYRLPMESSKVMPSVPSCSALP
ncbi:hypothetical protein PPL_02290 [Heterostelium album PN500]|uniref:Uncharacterized protein n=1 Tax=Heterostelium pallidum (strain ATCC 26659 / Pp 5 / PN500) TaxID=670386 RepID=D3B1W5_HETP5|nr:hypothetical protein PPL_02290 [Heterostelium album PN500]EFA85289.1 hypothetical protein PPL_02290 [Heterostelium album PN500]|eukprot:XP_020437398.1 hypothetical protein PPL_02290 [Heterostelium album PN500]